MNVDVLHYGNVMLNRGKNGVRAQLSHAVSNRFFKTGSTGYVSENREVPARINSFFQFEFRMEYPYAWIYVLCASAFIYKVTS